ncbi:MAG: dethiobiotin synthase [Gammaproteobacteria bacterium]|nr:dethiobiotin synthase [Gammaproteobacteria bacterium]
MKAYFITATDTDAGKTFVSSGILQYWSQQGYKALGFKPIASGCQPTSEGLRNDDALKLITASNVPLDYETINPYSFEPAIAPHIAAQQAGVHIDLQAIVSRIFQHQQKAERVLVEGVGGWLVPLNEQQDVADLACLLNFSVILVVNIRLGCINHALLTAQAIEQSGLKIAGWIANSPEPDSCAEQISSSELADTNNVGQNWSVFEENIQSIKTRLNAPLLGVLPHLSDSELHHEATSSLSHKKQFSDFVNMEKCI